MTDLKSKARTKRGLSDEHTQSGAESSQVKVSPNRYPCLRPLLSYLQWSKTKQLICFTSFASLRNNCSRREPELCRDKASCSVQASPPYHTQGRPLRSLLGEFSYSLLSPKSLMNRERTVCVRNTQSVHKHRRFGHTQLQTRESKAGVRAVQPEGFKLRGFLKIFLK